MKVKSVNDLKMVKNPNIVYILWEHHAIFGHGEIIGPRL